MPPSPSSQSPQPTTPSTLWSWTLGLFLALTLVKFANPIVLEPIIPPPQGWMEILWEPWPLKWAWPILFLLLIPAALRFHRPKSTPKWIWVPAAWFAWQSLATLTTVDSSLSHLTWVHFFFTTTLFYVGFYSLRQSEWQCILLGLLLGFGWVLYTGFEQRFGGLEATRNLIYEDPNWQQLPAEYLKKIASNRIFSTLVYPNALAGALLLLFPMLWTRLTHLTHPWPNIPRGVLLGTFLYATAACLYWSGSKAGWLIALVLIGGVLWQTPISIKIKTALLMAVALLGLAAFGIKYAEYFRKGATSVGARMDYWDAAWTTALESPVTGTGPGTFQIPYQRIKPPDAEMARLTHNDYLEQASDSGWIGFFLYLAIFPVAIVLLYFNARLQPETFSIWLGLLGWTLQSGVEFGLYIPALAWPAFLACGWLWRQALSASPSITPTNPNPQLEPSK